MKDKQNFNGNRGESRSHAILSENFYVSKRSVDVDGTDLIVEIPFEDISEFRKFKQQGVVQAKYFEGRNEVKIAQSYVHDEEGTRTNFFALIHTNDEKGNHQHYFFTAEQIIEKFRIRKSKKSSEHYYIFSITKSRKFINHRNLQIKIINKIIEEKILETQEYSRQKLIKEIEDKFNQRTKKRFNNLNVKFFKSIEGKHIIDKLYKSLKVYSEFRRITSWRLIKMISYPEKNNTSTYYSQFGLHTNHSEILDLFRNLNIDNQVSFKSNNSYKGVEDALSKVNTIIEILNHNLIIKIVDLTGGEEISIKMNGETKCNCQLCKFFKLDFVGAEKCLKFESIDLNEPWLDLRRPYTLSKLGFFDRAKRILNKLEKKSKEHKKSTINFAIKYNQRTLCWKTWEEDYPDLQYELNNLKIPSCNYEILNTLVSDTLTRDYKDSIDEVYLKIKEFKRRRIVNDTAYLINKLYTTYGEYVNFIEGNFLDIGRSTEFKIMSEKFIESLLISYSMNNSFSNHLNSLNDFMIRIIIHNSEPNKLLNYFQRNNVHKIPYESKSNYFLESIDNFFSNENIIFLKDEISYINNQTKNVNLRRKTESIFGNICILISYLDIDFSTINILAKVNNFINELDLSVHNISLLAHSLLKNPEHYESKDIIELIKILIRKDLVKGYLLTNSLKTLVRKNYVFEKNESKLVDEIIIAVKNNPSYGAMKPMPSLLVNSKFESFKECIQQELRNQFNNDLYYHSIINNCIEKSKEHLFLYIKPFKGIKPKNTLDFSQSLSPYTGIPYRISVQLNKLIDIIYVFDDDINMTAIKEVRLFHPYYDFMISAIEGNITSGFKPIWILENQSALVLEKLAKNEKLAKKIKLGLIQNYNEELAKLYMRHFN